MVCDTSSQFGVVELEVGVLVELHQHGAREDVVETPEMAQRLHRLVGVDRHVEAGFGEDVRVDAGRARRGKEAAAHGKHRRSRR